MESGLISLAPGVTLGSLQQFQLPVKSDESIQISCHSIDKRIGSDDNHDECAASGSNSSSENADDQELSVDEEATSGKRKTRSEADKVSLELRGLGVKDSRAARQLASNDARPSRFGKQRKRSKL
jgi:hypothetical protein